MTPGLMPEVMAAMNDTVLVSVEGAVATLTLNRPKVLNALNGDMIEALSSALDHVEADPALRVVILKGAGNGFMAGGDIKFFTEITGLAPADRRARFERFINDVHPVILRLRRLRQPVIAAVHGACAGFGMSLLMAADLAIAAEDSFFTLAYIHLGVSPDGGSTFALPRHLGAKKAMEIALLGDRFDAAGALALGLVNWVVPGPSLSERSRALAERLAQGPADAQAATKRLLNRSLDRTLEAQLQAELEAFARCTASGDFPEAVAAFVEKRAPRFGQN
jgi:2-(1,2-epoxy-1,2-dihydrophenyl)acetyl-CoA isomerase